MPNEKSIAISVYARINFGAVRPAQGNAIDGHWSVLNGITNEGGWGKDRKNNKPLPRYGGKNRVR